MRRWNDVAGRSAVERTALVLGTTRAQLGLTVALTLGAALDGHQLGAETIADHRGAANVGLREFDFDFHHD